ncbi:MAG: serine protease [Actinomycetota bacterium]|nr:serine protease [Actinomycetota bacterium]
MGVRRRLAGLCFGLLAVAVVPPAAGAVSADPLRSQQWALDRINEASVRGRGDGVIVAVVDTGIDLQHVDLRGRILPGTDIYSNDGDPQDENGHGTHVAGIIAADAGNGVGVAGVAPGAKLLPVRVLGPDGSGSSDDVIAGIRWAVAHGARVINLSIGDETQAVLGSTFSDALREAWKAGVVCVVAAGNQYVLGSGFADEPALVVSATTRDNTKPSYSSGVGSAKWGIAAPGGEQGAISADGEILSTYWYAGKHDQYGYDIGTSMAAPHVSGAIAVLLGLGLTPQQAVDRVLSTAKDLGAPGRDSTFGAGLLDIARATASDGIDPANTEPPTTAPPKTTAPRPAVSPTTVVGASPTPSVGAPTVTAQPSPSTTSKITGLRSRRTSTKTHEHKTAPGILAALFAIAAGTSALAIASRGRRTP